MIKATIVTDMVVIIILIAGDLFGRSPVKSSVLILAGVLLMLYLLALFLHLDSIWRKPVGFIIFTAISLVAVTMITRMDNFSVTRLLFVYYVIYSTYRAIETLGSFAYSLLFNLSLIVYIVGAALGSRLHLVDNWGEVVTLIILPVFISFKDWKGLAAAKDAVRSDITFKNTYDIQSKLLASMPVGLLIAEVSKVTYQSDRTRELLECSSTKQTYDCLAKVKVQSENIIFERRKDELKLDNPSPMETERISLKTNLSDSLKGVQHNLTLQGFLKLYLDRKFFIPNFNVEIQNALYKQKSFDFFIVSTMHLDRPSAMLVAIDSTFKTKKVFMEESDKYRTRVLGYISHSLKTPIHSLRDSLCRMSVHPTISANDYLSEQANLCLASCQQIAEMPYYIQTLVRLLSGQLVVEKCKLALRPFLAKLIADYHKHKPKMLQITCSVADDIPELVYTSPSLLAVLIKNFLGNSTKNTSRGYVAVNVETAKNKSNTLCVTIKDTGLGFSKQKLDSMLKELYQAKGSFQKFSELTVGLGFKLCHLVSMILAPEGEHFEIESEEDQGTTCSFLIDVDEGKSDQLKSQISKTMFVDESRLEKLDYREVRLDNCSSENMDPLDDCWQVEGLLEKKEDTKGALRNGVPTFPSMSEVIQGSTRINESAIDRKSLACPWCFDVLIVDDDRWNLDVLEEHLKAENWRTRQAYNGGDALALLKSRCLAGHPYSQCCRLVISDIEMPDMGGVELLSKLRALQHDGQMPRIPIVANTANIAEFENLVGSGDNFDALLPKPFYKDEILTIVHRLIPSLPANN